MARLRTKFRRKKKPRKKKRRKVNLRKALFVLPNLFTTSNIFCGFYSITLSMNASEPIQLYWAALAIFFGMFFDMADGRVARMTRTQSEFGVQLDSLADVVTFGCAPAVLLYRWSLHELGFIGIFISFCYLACGALRLARFNVMAGGDAPGPKDFVGLPIPLAAGTIVAMVMASYPFEKPLLGGSLGVGIVGISLGLLMVSNVRYRAFKNVRPNRRSISIAFVILLVFAGVSSQLKPAVALVCLFLGYIAEGLVSQVVFYPQRKAEKLAKSDPEMAIEDSGEVEAVTPEPATRESIEEDDEATSTTS